jgi:GntR family transcriptional regulator
VGEYGGLSGWLRDQGSVTGMRVVSAKVIAADERVSRGLAVDHGSFVFSIIRIPLDEGEPLSVEHSYIPVDMFPDLLEHQISESIGEIMTSRYNRPPIRAIEWLDAVAATPDQASALAVPVGAPLIAVERVTFDQDGERIEFANDLFRGDRTRVLSRSPLHVDSDMVTLER